MRLMADEFAVIGDPHRFRLRRAGVLNVWQYDEQVFEFADGRLLLRGANGAGKSKTLEMLLPFVLDGDKLHLTASGRHHTSLLWLMLEGAESEATTRTGYLWVEFARKIDEAQGELAEKGDEEFFTCGVGIRASQSSRSATSWYFTYPGRVGDDLVLEDELGPLGRERCRAALGSAGAFFDSARQYKEHVGRQLFGLDIARYNELLRLLYWLRQPQIGEDIEPGRLADILAIALPELDEAAVRSVGDSLDQLAEFGDELDRRARAADAVSGFAATYRNYAAAVVAERASALRAADRDRRHARRALEHLRRDLDGIEVALTLAERETSNARREKDQADDAIRGLEAGPEARSEQVLLEKDRRARELRQVADQARVRATFDDQRLRERSARDEQRTSDLLGEVGAIATGSHALAAELVRCEVDTTFAAPAELGQPRLRESGDADTIVGAVHALTTSLRAATDALGARLAAVHVARGALDDVERADTARAAAQRVEEAAEQREEAAARRHETAYAAATAAEEHLGAELRQWATLPLPAQVPLPDVALPDEFTDIALDELPDIARAAAAPGIEAARAAEIEAGSAAASATTRLAQLHSRRAAVEAEQDPAPPPPALPRRTRDETAVPLWLLVDFAAGVPQPERAAIEAALESSGILDAAIRPDGSVLIAGEFDTVLSLGPATSGGPTLADVLAVTVAEARIPADIVAGVLRRVAVVERLDDVAEFAHPSIARDGGWCLGVLSGRASKSVPQYVGASARAAERERRLTEIHDEIARTTVTLETALRHGQAAAAQRIALETWLQQMPLSTALREAWTKLAAASDDLQRALAEANVARADAARARSVLAELRHALDDLARANALPTDRMGLDARAEQLNQLTRQLERLAANASRLPAALAGWRDDFASRQVDSLAAQQTARHAEEAQSRAADAEAELALLLQAVGDDVAALRQKLVVQRNLAADAQARADAADRVIRELREKRGAATSGLEVAESDLAAAVGLVTAAAMRFARLLEVPGLFSAGLGRDPTADETATLGSLGTLERADGERLAADVEQLMARYADEAAPAKSVGENDIYGEWQVVASGPAAETQPRVIEVGGVLAVLARDDAGEHPLPVLAVRLAARVAADRELLSNRERDLFEEHLLGELGEALRSRRQEATELVAAMNRLLVGVRTSQGIGVRLDWALRDDVSAEIRDSVALLGRPVGALLPDERTKLRDALHTMIESSRAESPELSYAEHLGRALDYRRWSAFRVRLSRPETPGWTTLTRRTPLSQGEQKVVCYLPLFAAAAAHFTSVAGAAPYAPRFVLLDDAFPKIDVRTHPLLFGLLVDLDLDFVVTSERLWGDHATVPSLAIYEALRSPTERGIAQYRHLWDGQRLTAVGA